jgi:hypothetical protein
MTCHAMLFAGSSLLLFGMVSQAEIKIVADRNPNETATAQFKFKNVPAPWRSDAGSRAKFTIVDGQRDRNGGDLDKLHDGRVPAEEDEPAANFFFNATTEGGRLLVELDRAIEIKQVNTYSWHSNTRGPQVYNLYATEGKADGFNAQPKKGTAPEKCGWRLVAKVDTRPKGGESGGQYGVCISDSDGSIGQYRFLLFDIFRTEEADPFGNTFYSEIDVIGKDDAEGPTPTAVALAAPYITHSPDGYCEISIDTAGAPDLKDWAEQKLAPALAEWYPKIVSMLPSEGFAPPKKFSVSIKPGNGVAATGGTRVTANSAWLKRELNGEAIGSLIHEEVHVIQQYGSARRNNPNATRTPGWVTEGIPDYIRWFKYEPQSHGADLTWVRARKNFTPRYDGSYRVSANFLDWVTEKHDKEIVKKLNTAARQSKYNEELWKNATGKTVQELGEEWKKDLQEKLATPAASPR